MGREVRNPMTHVAKLLGHYSSEVSVTIHKSVQV